MSSRTERVFLSLGGNLGDPAEAMATALAMLVSDPKVRVVAVSSLYRTPPWGKIDQPDFLNATAELATEHAPRALLERCLRAERRLKRVRAERWGPRLIDMDILVYGDRTLHEDGLEIPHPRMLDRAFVMVPLAEIAPDFELSGKSIRAHVAGLDVSGIDRLPDPDWWRR
ncbi:2-amino-4-hydroxy-6-hydroxymethyldihydropteridine diphosphokinase [Mesorhizobium sp. NBSH29]|uniref:2-amino-4-hydroxy-6- hydroxymethyldihydropteridine diphosphokinase n=1 Tax=Mesorhizobium sp. NBSH29 TaxID=2654249 RepID=UPI0035BC0136